MPVENMFDDYLKDIMVWCDHGKDIAWMLTQLNGKRKEGDPEFKYNSLKSYLNRTGDLKAIRIRNVKKGKQAVVELLNAPVNYDSAKPTMDRLAGIYPFVDEIRAKYGTSKVDGGNAPIDPLDPVEVLFFGMCRAVDKMSIPIGDVSFQMNMAIWMKCFEMLESLQRKGTAGIEKVLFAVNGIAAENGVDINKYIEVLERVDRIENERSNDKARQLGLFTT